MIKKQKLSEQSKECVFERGVCQQIISKIKSKVGCGVFVASLYCGVYGGMNYLYRQQSIQRKLFTHQRSRSECSQFPGCQSLYDGCNMCQCRKDEVDICTLMFCETYERGKCEECEQGYSMKSDGTCQEPACGGFKHCAAYFDGCNNCDCFSDGTKLCTEKYCHPSNYKEEKCIRCEDGFELSEYNQCVPECPKLRCVDPCPMNKCMPWEECKTKETFLKSRPECPGCPIFDGCH